MPGSLHQSALHQGQLLRVLHRSQHLQVLPKALPPFPLFRAETQGDRRAPESCLLSRQVHPVSPSREVNCGRVLQWPRLDLQRGQQEEVEEEKQQSASGSGTRPIAHQREQ